MYWKLRTFFAVDDGAGSGGETQPPAPTEDGNSGDGNKELFTPEQQAHIEALINKAYAKGAAKAAKTAEREKQTEAEKLAAERAELEAEKARLKAQNILSKNGYMLGEDEIDSALVGLFAIEPDAAETNCAALRKLIDAKVNEEVDKRLKGAKQPTPKSGDNGVTVGDAINGLFRNIKK